VLVLRQVAAHLPASAVRFEPDLNSS
jgi:hypothetical protein